MADSFKETKTISYGQNIKNSFSGLIAGFLLFIASFVVLWTNEGNNVAQIKKAEFMGKNAINISADNINRENDNKLVCLSGKAITNTTLSDNIITAENVFVLNRKVEMYQWKEKVKTETQDKIGGETVETKTYSYEKVWSEEPIDSKEFKKTSYANPAFPFKSEEVYAKTGQLGEFNLTDKQIKAMNEYSAYTDLPQNDAYKIDNGLYYKGKDPLNPLIGDLKISYTVIPSGVNISVIAKQNPDNTLTPMVTKNSSVYLQQSGLKTKDEMLNTFKQNNKFFTNIIRFFGWLLMFTGLNLIINPLTVILKVIPFVARIAEFISKGVLFLLSVILSLVTIALAWFAFRPVISIVLLVTAGVICFFIKTKVKSNHVQTEKNN